MARVYLAEDTESGVPVAIKVLKPELASAVATERFLREIRLIQGLRHSHVVPLLDAGEHDGVPYFVMPYVEGESLRQLLTREKQLPVETAIRVTRALASALEVAHAKGIVHRDVKPENVLFDGTHVLLADFGIARAFSEAAGEKLTESGIALGTPGYMSPEQAAGEKQLDGRSDVYALAVVAYEMLAGEPPFTGPTMQAVIAKQMTLDVPPVHVLRDSLTDAVDDVFRRALAKVPADRYAGATAFANDLAEATRAGSGGVTRALRRVVRVARSRTGQVVAGGVALAVLAGGAWRLASTAREDHNGSRAAAGIGDTTQLALLPVYTRNVGGVDAEAMRRVLRQSILRWSGIRVLADAVVDETVAGGAGEAAGKREPSPRAAAPRVRRAGGGRFITSSVAPSPNGAALRIQLFEAAGDGALLAEASVPLGSDTAVFRAVDSLLLRDAFIPDEPSMAGTRSLPARQAYVAGRHAVDRWELEKADSAFSLALRHDGRFAHASLWLAVSRLWSGRDPLRWQLAAEQALLGDGALTPRERVIATAVQAQAKDDLGRACALWESLVTSDSLDAFAWFGAANCHAADNVVLRDARSPSGWRFRSSYHHALRQYQRSFRLHPPILAAFSGREFEKLQRLFRVAGNQLRGGRAERPSTQHFASSMTWSGDTLAFIPYPRGDTEPPRVMRGAAGMNEAVRHQRETVRGIASAWVAAFPQRSDAWQALGMALASMGDAAALDTLARAVSLARDDAERARAIGAQVAALVAFGVRDVDSRRVEVARALADSLLTRVPVTADAPLLCSLAALTGRAALAARYARAPAVGDLMAVPPVLRESGPALVVFAALWGPADTLRGLEEEVTTRIAQGMRPAERAMPRLAWLARAASLAFPAHRFRQLDTLAREGDELVAIQAALVRGDSARVRAGLAAMRDDRRDVAPEQLTLDGLVPEAALLLATGDVGAAAAWLDPTLGEQPLVSPSLLASPVRAASVGTAALLRARIAMRGGDPELARRWGAVVGALWRHADAHLEAAVRQVAGAGNTGRR